MKVFMQPKDARIVMIFMSYNIRVDRIAQDIPDEVQKSILEFLKTYDFRYATCISNKTALREVFIDHFKNRHDLEWLKQKLYDLATQEDRSLRGIASCAWSETNRVHTMGLGKLLLSKGIKKCTTTHSYGLPSTASDICRKTLEGKELDIQEILDNTFPKTPQDLMRTDIPMIPQHLNCRHVMTPIQTKPTTKKRLITQQPT